MVNHQARQNSAHIKAGLLAEGLRLSEAFLEVYQEPFLVKRRAYGNSDAEIYLDRDIPQELFIGEDIVCGVHARPQSNWCLDVCRGNFVITHAGNTVVDVNFPQTPAFYKSRLSSGRLGNQIGTLYGGRSLGIFVYGSCALVDANAACRYCSIAPNRSRQTEFVEVVKPREVYELVKAALESDPTLFSQVMINGGNFKDRNRGFRYYTSVCEAARRAINDCQKSTQVELHLIIFPPASVSLVDALAEFDVCVAMNTEVFDRNLFAEYCPGKMDLGGHDVIFSTLDRAVKVLGPGRVFSIFVGGLESLESLRRGIDHAFCRGVIPIINVFHADPGTPLASRPSPDAGFIIDCGRALQTAYSLNHFSRPFYERCGRNALDTEAYLQLF